MTPQQQMQQRLSALGLPSRQINCYGSQIVVTCDSLGSAQKWASVLGRFATVRGMTQAREPNQQQLGRRLIETHEVYRVFARV